MKRLIALIIACVMVMSCLCACSKGPVSLDKGNKHNNYVTESSEEKFGEESEAESAEENVDNSDETIAEEPEETNKYIDVSRIVAAYDDVVIFETHNATYGLMSTDGEMICNDIITTASCANFEFGNNYMCCGIGNGLRTDVQTVIDKAGNAVLSVGKDNIEYISEITQGRILAYQMTDERPSGKTYDLICYSAKDMSEVFRIQEVTEYSYSTNIRFDEKGYIPVRHYYDIDYVDFEVWADSKDDFYVDINGNRYRSFSYKQGIIVSEVSGQQFANYDELPIADGAELYIDWYVWNKLAESYIEYKNSSNTEFAVGTTRNTMGPIVTLYMNSTSEWCATMDSSGNVLMPATKNILMRYRNISGAIVPYTFSHDLCCAYGVEEEKWGYIDPYGDWQITPQYSSVNTFSYDGYAVVDRYKVIDTQGETILDISNTSDLASLQGTFTFRSKGITGNMLTHTITFYEDGTFTHVRPSVTGLEGKYQLRGNEIRFDGGWTADDPYYNYSHSQTDVNCSFQRNGKNLVINGIEWVYQPEDAEAQ